MISCVLCVVNFLAPRLAKIEFTRKDKEKGR